MPKPVALNEIVNVVLVYVVKRQRQGRPTTLRQVSKRVGVGAPTIQSLLDEAKVLYYVIAYGEDYRKHKVEVAIRTLPEKVAIRAGLTVEMVEKSYRDVFGEGEPQIIQEIEPSENRGEETPALGLKGEVIGDPYAPYRIGSDEYRKLEKRLITYEDLIRQGRERGAAGSAVMRAVGGDRMKYPLVSSLWRPYVYRNHRYYLKEVLKNLDEVYTTYKHPAYGEIKKKRFKRAQAEAKKEREL